jgi:hypothetical protein
MTIPEQILPRYQIFLYAGLGALGAFDMTYASAQLAYGYFTGIGLDVTQSDFIHDAMLFLALTYVCAYALRALFRYWGLRRTLNQRLVIANYEAPCPPAVAGVLYDGIFDTGEVTAALLDLEYRGFVEQDEAKDGQKYIKRLSANPEDLLPFEQLFLDELFGLEAEIRLSKLDPRLMQAGQAMHDRIYQQALAEGLIRRPNSWDRLFAMINTGLANFGFAAAFIVATHSLDPSTYTITCPCYPVYAWQLGFIVLQLGILIAVCGQAYRAALLSQSGRDLQVQLAGFYLFLKVAYVERLSSLSPEEQAKYYPYAVALRLV